MAAPFSLGDAEDLRALLTGAGFRDVTIELLVRTARFRSSAQFVRLSVLGAAAAVPELARMDAMARDSLIDAVRGDVDQALRSCTDGTALTFPLQANVAAARA